MPIREILRRTEGWLDLGCPEEALKELEALPDVMHATREVLKLKCRALHVASNWKELLCLSATCADYFPRELAFVRECEFARQRLLTTPEEQFHLRGRAMTLFQPRVHPPS